MSYIYLPVFYYHGNIYVTEGAYAGGRGFPLSQRSFLLVISMVQAYRLSKDGMFKRYFQKTRNCL